LSSAWTSEISPPAFYLILGSYSFRTNYNTTQFWSGEVNHCSVPGCISATVTVPAAPGEVVSTIITYTYDPLYRLTAADYSSGEFFHYTYDAVGNRLTQGTHEGTNTYTYDIANRLVEVDGVSYTWSATGNLLSDGIHTYTYDHANRLTSVVQANIQGQES
jgi:YD repeat-containing protein